MLNLYFMAMVTLAASVVHVPNAEADLMHFPDDADGWQSTVANYNAIDFGGYQHGQLITNEYSPLGITFTNTVYIQEGSLWSNGFGLFGEDGIHILLDQPHQAIAVDHLGSVTFALFYHGEQIGTSNWFAYPGIEPRFSAIISDQPFDEVFLFKPQPPFDNNIISIDTLYWGMPVPAPGAILLFALALIGPRHRRRRTC